METQNSVWFELERGTDEEMRHRCTQLNKILNALTGKDYDCFFVREGRYFYSASKNSGVTMLKDNGQWFNLDGLAKCADELRKSEPA